MTAPNRSAVSKRVITERRRGGTTSSPGTAPAWIDRVEGPRSSSAMPGV